MSNLPPELTSAIFERLEIADVRHCNQVCRHWREVIAANPNIQRELWLRSDTAVEIGDCYRPPHHPYFAHPMPITVNPNILSVTEERKSWGKKVPFNVGRSGGFPTSLKIPDSRMEQYLTKPRVERVAAFFPVILPYGKEHEVGFKGMIRIVEAPDGVKLKHLVKAFEELMKVVKTKNIKFMIRWRDGYVGLGNVKVAHEE